MNNFFLFCILITTTFIILQSCDCAKIDKKLDFSESEEDDEDDESGSDMSDSESASSDKNTATIKSVKISVDTKTKKKGSPEAKSESNESGEIKTVGIRTDITVEISSEINGTSKNTKKGDKGGKDQPKNDNASVPVYKGRDTPNPNPPSIVNNNNYPIFHGTNDEHAIRRFGSDDHWNKFLPITGIWTTERTFYRRIHDDNRSNGPLYKGFSNWKPCFCSVYHPVRPTYDSIPYPREHYHVDDKLDYPFRRINK